jgi:hypothetical protein
VAAGVVLEEDELAVLADDAEGVDVGLQLGRDGHVRHVRTIMPLWRSSRPEFQLKAFLR